MLGDENSLQLKFAPFGPANSLANVGVTQVGLLENETRDSTSKFQIGLGSLERTPTMVGTNLGV